MGEKRKIVVIMWIVLMTVVIVGNNIVEGYRTLPENLRECYSNDGVFIPDLPLNLRVFLDILRKVERHTATSMSMRTLASALIKRFKLDGIKYSPQLLARPDVLRFAAWGYQRARNRIVERLVPGDASLFPDDVLNRDERCVLHFALSNTIWDKFKNGEEEFCNPPPTEKFAGSVPYRSFTPNVDRCPKESGVVLTPFGTVALGSVISAIAAGLEPQTVKTRLLLTMPVDDDGNGNAGIQGRGLPDDDDGEEVDFVLPRERMNANRSMWLESAKIADTQIDNVWIATISGELAEMVIYQGPIYEHRMYLGASGFWNNTMRPQIYYVGHRYDKFEATRAEIVGGIDGLIIAKNLEDWTKNFESLRLSQILDMYYSEKGVVFDKNVKACRRGDQFPRIGPKSIIEEQTYAASQVLAYLNSIAAMSNEALQRLVVRSVEHFAHYTDDHLFTEVQCRNAKPHRARPQLEIAVAFDGSWTREYTADFLAVLVDDLDVSAYGSKMGIIDGETGDWLVNVSSSSSDLHQGINNLQNVTWPKTINFAAIFGKVHSYLDDLWSEKRANNTIGNVGHAVVLIAPQVSLSDEDTRLALSALRHLKSAHPEVHFLYFTVEAKAELFRSFLLSDEDRIVKSLDVDDISRLLSTVPVTLRPVGCNHNVPGTRLQLEDYVNPGESLVYRLHPQWRVKTKKITITFHGVGYGTMKVCWWNQWTANSPKFGQYCKNLGMYEDISLTDYQTCGKDNKCPNTFVKVSNVTGVTRCTELDCRTPDQVRFIVRMENLQCVSSSEAIAASLAFLIIPLVIFSVL